MPKKPTYKKVETFVPPHSIYLINTQTTATFERTRPRSTHNNREWYIYKYTEVPMPDVAGFLGKELPLVREDIERLAKARYCIITWTK